MRNYEIINKSESGRIERAIERFNLRETLQ
jgi:hypothetical protein